MKGRQLFRSKRLYALLSIIIILSASLVTFLVTNTAQAEPLPGCRRVQGCVTPTPTIPQDGPTIPITTCSQSPSSPACDNQDPIEEKCAGQGITNVRTDASVPIKQNGTVIGLVERRYSPTCNSYWARVTYLLFGTTGDVPGGNIEIQINNLTVPRDFADNGIWKYSNMIFGQKPTITGTVFTAPNTPVSATIAP